MFFNKFASCSIPYFNLLLFFIVDSLALALNSLGLFTYIKKKGISIYNFANKLGHLIIINY